MRAGDAREVLEGVRADTFDLLVVDVFSGARTPAHLTSIEFVQAADRALNADGLYVANVADGAQLAFARAQVATARAVFGQVCLIGDPAVLRGRRFGNLIVVAGHRELPIADLARAVAGDPFPARVEHGAELIRFTGGAVPVTDATATPSPNPPTGIFG